MCLEAVRYRIGNRLRKKAGESRISLGGPLARRILGHQRRPFIHIQVFLLNTVHDTAKDPKKVPSNIFY
jgi:hypothetical protein